MSIAIFDHPAIPLNEQARQRAVVHSNLLAMKGDSRLMRIASDARHVARTKSAAITVIVGDNQHLIATSGTAMGVSRRSTSFCGHIIADAVDILCIHDATLEPRFRGNPFVDDGIVRFYAGLAIRDIKGLILGALCVFDPLPRAEFTACQKTALVHLGKTIIPSAQEITSSASRADLSPLPA